MIPRILSPRLLRLALFVLMLSSPAVTQLSAQATQDLPFARAKHLQRGINASMWFAQARDYSPARLSTYTTAADIALMHQLGFDHVRLSIDAEALVRNPGPDGLNAAFTKELDNAVHTMLADQLAVIVDVHPSEDYKRRLRADPAAVADFVRLWRSLAAHYAATDPERVFFEVLNEPEFEDAQHWNDTQSQAIAAIRAEAPRHTIVATSLHYSGIEDLLASALVADPNVIYTFHDYEPFAFTHQGATWTDKRVQPLRRVPYPSSAQAVAPLLDQEPTDPARFWFNNYGLDRWDAARIAAQLAFAGRWSREHHVPVYCGEFGAYRTYSDPAMRAAWVHDTRIALESNSVGWAMWDYQGGFALVDKVNGKPVPIPALVQALGLHQP